MLATLFWVLAALAVVGALAIVWGLYLLARRSGFSSETRAGVEHARARPRPVRWRARGRIEHTLLDGGGASPQPT